MYRNILVPIDLADTALAKPAIAAARVMASQSSGGIRLVNVLPLTPVVLAEYVPADFDAHQEILEEAVACGADLIVMTSQRGQRHAVRTYFLGSSTGHVVRYAKCSVLVVRN